jgi:hypothetical protein
VRHAQSTGGRGRCALTAFTIVATPLFLPAGWLILAVRLAAREFKAALQFRSQQLRSEPTQ